MMKMKKPLSLHSESIIIDGLNVSVWDEDVFNRLKNGGVTSVNATIVCWENFREAISNIEKWNEKFETFKDLIMQVKTIEDIKRAKSEKKVGIVLGFQNGTPIEDDINLIRIFHDLGVRIIQLTYQDRNYIGDGCWESKDAGLSEFGYRVVKEMNRQGILIDLSHASEKTSMEVIEASKDPVAFTHANPKSIVDNPRNKSDEQLLALAEKGGVIGATLYPPLLVGGEGSTIEDYLDVIDYLVKLVGIEHVALGTDFTEKQPKEFFIYALTGKSWEKPLAEIKYPIIYPKGISSARDFPKITEGLMKRGYSDNDTRKIIGENWLQLFSKVWGINS